MNRYQTSKSSLFLLEIIIDLFIFAFLCAYGLLFFIKSSNMTSDTTTLHQASKITSCIANVYEGGDGSLEAILEEYSNGTKTADGLLIYFDEHYLPCSEDASSFLCIVKQSDSYPSKIQVDFCDTEQTSLYSIEACHYVPLTPQNYREGAGS